jgi:hypothetical protein
LLAKVKSWGRWSLATGLAITLFACASSSDDAPSNAEPSDTGATCPADSTLTYEGWAQGFFESYCTRCHSSALVDDERNGAPPHADWDEYQSIHAYKDEIAGFASGGPDWINRTMPPSDPRPPDDERLKLGEWLACGLPKQ